MTNQRAGHVSDERLVEVCIDRAATAVEDVHFAECGACADRRHRLHRLLHDVTGAAAACADAAFPEDRLASQRASILQRIAQEGRPARVITFPAASPSDPRPLRARPAARWIAGAAAAGLAIGLLAGHLAHDLPTLGRPERTALTTAPLSRVAQPSHQIVNASLNDDEFLGEIEDAVHGPRLTALRPLNDLTPQ